MATVRIWTARLHDKEEMYLLQCQVEQELTQNKTATATWLMAGSGGDAHCAAIVEVR